LHASEERFQLLVNAVVDYAIFMLDKEGYVSSWNAGAERIKGYRADEIIGQHFSKFYSPEDQAKGLPAKGLTTAAREGHFEAEGWRVKQDGTRFWANVVIDAIKDENGELIGFAKITRDLTERRAHQEALERAREDLHQSQKLEALGQLSGGVAHDFNNMLTAIISNLQLVQASVAMTGAARRQFDAALQAARNGAAVVRQMLVFARKQSLQPSTFDVRNAIEEIAALIRRSCTENVELEIDLPAEPMLALAERSQLQTSILNLVLNSCDAMPEGGRLTISVSRRRLGHHEKLAAGDYISIKVADSGVGIPPEVLARVFEPFFTTKEVGKGTGLGLRTVYGSMRQLGGDVHIATEVGRGTTVELLLPAGAADAQIEEPVLEAAPAAKARPKATILYVEDDFLVGMATMDLLQSEGYLVLSAPRSDVALRTLASNSEVDLLITDIGLPGMNGHELVAEARRRHGPIRVLFLTGYDRTGPMNATGADPITRYLDKPYDPADLAQAVRELLAEPVPSA
jgi:PAS domain S-box-containing protein